MNKQSILVNFKRLDTELSLLGVYGKVALVGGAVMCFVFGSREYNLTSNWLNDGVKGFISNSGIYASYKVFIVTCG